MAHSYFVTFFNYSIKSLSIFLSLLFSFSSLANDCSFGGAGTVLKFPAGSTQYNYSSVNDYLYSCIVTEFKDNYVNAGMQISVKNEIRNESDLKKVVAGFKQGKYTNSSKGTPNSDKDILENVSRFARKVKVSCVKDSNYIASINAMGPTSFSTEADRFISYCYQISQLADLTLSLDESGKTTLDPSLIADLTLRDYYIQCESSAAPALACQALCISNAPEAYKKIGCDQFRNKYSGPQPALATLAEQCAPLINTNPSHPSCQQLCDAQASSCLDGLTAATESDADADADAGAGGAATDTADASGSGDTTNPTGGDTTDKLTEAANDAARSVFGNNSGTTLNNSSNSSEVTSPTNSIGAGLKASNLNSGNGNEPMQLNGQAANVLPSSANLPLNTRGEPGGVKKGDSPRGSGPRGGGGGGFNAGGSGGGGGKADSRGGRRYGSKTTKAEDIDLNRFLGTNGSPGGGSPVSALSQKLKDQINKNKKGDGSGNTKKINAAFQKGLNRGVSNSSGFLTEGQFFPEAEAAYEYIRNSEVLPNEKGHL